MLKVKKHGVILAPTSREFECLSAFNPGVLQEGNAVHIVYRAQNSNYISSLGYARLKGPLKVEERWKQPFMRPKFNYECKGIEDPRLVKIKDTIYMTFVAHDGKHALIAYASGQDIFDLKHQGIISPKITYARAAKLFGHSSLKDDYYFFASFYKEHAAKDVMVWEKDGILFPEKIKRKYALLHRILPDIQMALAKDLTEYKNSNYWLEHIKNMSKDVILEGKYGFEARHIGGGAPPVKTPKGWLIIYHAAEQSNAGRVYTAGAALLDINDPRQVIARLPYPLFSPVENYERKGHVHNVVFPTGTSFFNGRLYIYYGSADTYVAAASVNLNELLKELLRHKVKPV